MDKKELQMFLGCKPDGVIGPVTRALEDRWNDFSNRLEEAGLEFDIQPNIGKDHYHVRGGDPTCLMIHDTVGPSVRSAINTWKGRRARGGGAYGTGVFIESSGRLVFMSSPWAKTSHAAGWNDVSYGVDMVCPLSYSSRYELRWPVRKQRIGVKRPRVVAIHGWTEAQKESLSKLMRVFCDFFSLGEPSMPKEKYGYGEEGKYNPTDFTAFAHGQVEDRRWDGLQAVEGFL